MKISIIIVNYNVEPFLEQCLHSVLKAVRGIEGEIIVVDNNSVDGSVNMLNEKFPGVKKILNTENKGFSFANNQAIRVSRGEFVLLLNPDTVVQEDTFQKTLSFMDQNPEAGALGVKMVDGKGNFLPESKRGMPTPRVAFYKIFGLARLLPRSRKFGKYHLTYLDKDQTNEIDVLSGAFMLIRKTALDKCGLLDETFFMYGEDIDLSYRIIKSGYKNYYYPGTCIIHYKGESTRKSSINYVFVFYKAMAIFARKHYSGGKAFYFNLLIHLAIYVRAGISVVWRLLKQFALPFFDFNLILGGLFTVKEVYEKQIKFSEGEGNYLPELVKFAFLGYSAVWVGSCYFNGVYDKPFKSRRLVFGILSGAIIILVAYSLLPEVYRFSRAIILLGTLSTLVGLLFFRIVLHLFGIRGFKWGAQEQKRIAIIGEEEECNRVKDLLKNTPAKGAFIGFVSSGKSAGQGSLGHVLQLDEIIQIHKIDELIFCSKDISSSEIISKMLNLGKSSVDFKIAPPESLSIIGSNSIDTAGDLYVIDFNAVSKPHNRRVKRVFDISISGLFFLLSPILLLIQRKPRRFFLNLAQVGVGMKTWVGYERASDPRLPRIKKGIFTPYSPRSIQDSSLVNKLNFNYGKNYKVENDVKIVLGNLRNIGDITE